MAIIRKSEVLYKDDRGMHHDISSMDTSHIENTISHLRRRVTYFEAICDEKMAIDPDNPGTEGLMFGISEARASIDILSNELNLRLTAGDYYNRMDEDD